MMRWIGCIACALALVGIRAFADGHFYDPFAVYFESGGGIKQLPTFDWSKLLGFLWLRFWLNMGVCLVLIYLLFQEVKLVKLGLIIGLVWSIVFLLLYGLQLVFDFPFGDNIAFYNRRFIVHPVLGILLIPALYFQRHQEKR